MKVDKNEQGFLTVGDYVELDNVYELDMYAFGQGLGKVVIEDNEEVLGLLEPSELRVSNLQPKSLHSRSWVTVLLLWVMAILVMTSISVMACM